jgi:hypothetical protein
VLERFHYFIFKPVLVKCFNCKAQGASRLHKPHQFAFFALLVGTFVLSWLTGLIPEAWVPVPRPILLGSYFGPTYTPWMVGVWWLVVLSMLFSMKGHRCKECGSEYIKATAIKKKH